MLIFSPPALRSLIGERRQVSRGAVPPIVFFCRSRSFQPKMKCPKVNFTLASKWCYPRYIALKVNGARITLPLPHNKLNSPTQSAHPWAMPFGRFWHLPRSITCLAIQNQIWTVDRLEKCGWPNCGFCPLCNKSRYRLTTSYSSVGSPWDYGAWWRLVSTSDNIDTSVG